VLLSAIMVMLPSSASAANRCSDNPPDCLSTYVCIDKIEGDFCTLPGYGQYYGTCVGFGGPTLRPCCKCVKCEDVPAITPPGFLLALLSLLGLGAFAMRKMYKK
jgi:hypothetical protein